MCHIQHWLSYTWSLQRDAGIELHLLASFGVSCHAKAGKPPKHSLCAHALILLFDTQCPMLQRFFKKTAY